MKDSKHFFEFSVSLFVGLICGVGSSSRCPSPQSLYPLCSCSSEGDDIDIDCRNDNADELKTIFKSIADELSRDEDRHLHSFYIYNSSATELPENLFSGITFEVISIYKAYRLSTISARAFAGTDAYVRQLLVQHAPVGDSVFESIKSMANLETIVFDNISLSALQTFNASKLKVIDLRNNRVKTIAGNTFRDMDDLQSIGIDDNQIDYIDNCAFNFSVKSSKKMDIHLKNNRLNATKSFALNAFTRINRPFQLWLGYNPQLAYLDEQIFGPILDSGNEIQIYGGDIKLECDCRMAWIANRRERYVNQVHNAVCVDGGDLFDSNRKSFINCHI